MKNKYEFWNDLAFYVVVGILVTLTAGTPDLLDSIMSYIDRH